MFHASRPPAPVLVPRPAPDDSQGLQQLERLIASSGIRCSDAQDAGSWSNQAWSNPSEAINLPDNVRPRCGCAALQIFTTAVEWTEGCRLCTFGQLEDLGISSVDEISANHEEWDQHGATSAAAVPDSAELPICSHFAAFGWCPKGYERGRQIALLA